MCHENFYGFGRYLKLCIVLNTFIVLEIGFHRKLLLLFTKWLLLINFEVTKES